MAFLDFLHKIVSTLIQDKKGASKKKRKSARIRVKRSKAKPLLESLSKKSSRKTQAVKKPATKKPSAKLKRKDLKEKSKKNSKKIYPEKYVGNITHYFSRIKVVVVKLDHDQIKIGDRLHIKGKDTDFRQEITSLQIESQNVRMAKKGHLVGLQVKEQAKVGDKIYKIENNPA